MLNKITKTILVILVLIVTFLLVYSPHFNYPYPLHVDEWNHINMAESRANYSNFPFLYGQFGYHLFLMFIFSLLEFLHINVILAYKFFPAIFACFASLILFLFTYKLTKNFFIALFSMIFFASLPSDINLLGLWFATSLTLAIPFFYLFFYFFIKSLEQADLDNKISKNLIFATILIFIIAMIHPTSAALIFPILLVYLTINYKIIRKKPLYLLIFLPFILAFLVFMKINWTGSFITTFISLVSQIVFKYGATPLEPGITENPVLFSILGNQISISPYFLPILYGIIPFTLAIIGLYFSIKKEKLRILAIWFLVTLFLLFLFNFAEFTIFARRQRILYYSMLSLAPLSAIGLYKILNFTKNKLNNKKKLIKILIISLILIFVLFATFYNYGKQRQGTELYYLINDADYKAINFLKNQQGYGVMAPFEKGITIYPITRKLNTIGIYPVIGESETKKDVGTFYASDCKGKKEIINKYPYIDYVYSKNKISCDYLDEIYFNEVYIYKIKK